MTDADAPTIYQQRDQWIAAHNAAQQENAELRHMLAALLLPAMTGGATDAQVVEAKRLLAR